MMRLPGLFVAMLLVLLFAGPAVAAEEHEKKHPYRGGTLRLGPYYLTQIKTQIQVDDANAPIGTHVNFEDELGIKDSATVPRVTIDYRFSKRHAIAAKWYKLERTGSTVLGREIQFGDRVFLAGTEVDSLIDTEMLTLEYVWAFYESDKVALGLSAGLSVSTIRTGIGTSLDGGAEAHTENLTIPIPTIGGRFGYKVNRKLSVLARFDLLNIQYGEFSGSVLDAWFAAEHHTFKHVGFGGSVGRLTMDFELDDDKLFWDVSHHFTAVMAHVAVYF